MGEGRGEVIRRRGMTRFLARMRAVPKPQREQTVLAMVKRRLSLLDLENEGLRKRVEVLEASLRGLGLDERIVAAGMRLAFADLRFATTLTDGPGGPDYIEEQEIHADYFAAQDAFREALKAKSREGGGRAE